MAYQQVIFDLDGTLLNTLDDLTRACNHICKIHGWPRFEQDAVRRKIGNGLRILTERIMPAELTSNTPLKDATYQELRTYYLAHNAERTAPYPGIAPLLKTLKTAGITLAVLTNKDHTAARILVERFFWSGSL